MTMGSIHRHCEVNVILELIVEGKREEQVKT
jgi:hypothetical protein